MGVIGRPCVEMPINHKSTEPNFLRCPRVTKDIWCIFGIGDGSGIHTGTTWSYGTPSYLKYSRP